MRSLHVGVAQVQSRMGDPWANLARMYRQIRAGAAVGVEALLFAETAMHAYDLSPANLALAEPLGGPLSRQVQAWAEEFDMTILAGMLERDGDAVYNAQLIAWPDGRLARERKHNLTAMEVEAGVAPGARTRTLFDIKGVCCGVLICADTGIEGIYAEMRAQGAEYSFIPTAGGGTREDYLPLAALETEEGRACYEAERQRVFNPAAILTTDERAIPGWASANALGDDGRAMMHRGHCMIVDPQRVMRAQIPGTNIIEHLLDQMVHAVIYFP